jgi:hypothetical protein
MDDDIERMLAEIENLHIEMKKQKSSADYRFALQTIIGFYALYLIKIFHRSQGLTRPLTEVRATDLLLIMYTSAATTFLL